MDSCVPSCRNRKFAKKEIELFSNRMQNVLENNDARDVFEDYLHQVRRRDLLKVLKLWKDADKCLKEHRQFPQNEMLDQIDEIDDFNTNPFLSISENNNKLIYVKQECARILNKVLSIFIRYLEQYHKV